MTGAVGGASRAAAIQSVTQLGWLRTFPVVDDEVDRHLALQAADISMAEVVTEFVYLEYKKERDESFVSRKLTLVVDSRTN